MMRLFLETYPLDGKDDKAICSLETNPEDNQDDETVIGD
jgi:hypothetical protein